jgi:hypothetical protein
MSNESGKWRALDTSGSTAHACQLNERPPARPVLSPTVEKTATENVQQILRFDTDVIPGNDDGAFSHCIWRRWRCM